MAENPFVTSSIWDNPIPNQNNASAATTTTTASTPAVSSAPKPVTTPAVTTPSASTATSAVTTPVTTDQKLQTANTDQGAADDAYKAAHPELFNKGMTVGSETPVAAPTTAPVSTSADKTSDNLSKVSLAINSGYASANDIAANTGLSVDDVNNIINNDASLKKTLTLNQESNQIKSNMSDLYGSMDKITNGTYTLTPGEQAQINDIRNTYAELERKQALVNQAYEGSVGTAEIRSGRQEFMNQISSGIYKNAVDSGVQKIADLEAKATAAVNTLTQAFEDKDYDKLNNQYKILQDTLTQKTSEIEKIQKATADMAKTVQDQQKFDLEVAKYYSDIDYQNAQLNQKSQEVMTVTPGSSIYTKDGTFVGTAPEKPVNAMDYIKTVGDSLLQFDPNTNSWSVKYTAPTKPGETSKIVKVNGVDYQLNADGSYTTPQVPAETKKATELENSALTSAQALLDKFNKRQGTQIVGASRFWTGGKAIPGTASADFEAQFNNLTSLLSLDNVKYLKGQGQVSDAERKLLADSATKLNLNQSESEFKQTLSDIVETLKTATTNIPVNNTLSNPVSKFNDWYANEVPDGDIPVIDKMLNDPNLGKTETERKQAILEYYKISFNNGGGGTPIASEAKKVVDGTVGGECGHFVNQITGLGMGDSYQSKLSKMDNSITTPKPGMVFVMPYKDTGHTGIILAVNNGIATVKDSNYSLDGKIKTHTIPVSKMTGFKLV